MMTTSNGLSEGEVIAQRLEEFQKKYYDSVDSYFQRGDRAKGNAAFSSWERLFLDFLDNDLPGLREQYKDHLAQNSHAGLAMLTVHQNWKGKRGDAVESFLAQEIEDARAGNLATYISRKQHPLFRENLLPFVDTSRIAQLMRIKRDKFDLARLIRLCEELNTCYSNHALYATAMLTRSVLDHVPPIFGCTSFAQVANNYAGTKSFKDSMRHLEESSRNISDASLHTQVRSKEILLAPTQVNFFQEVGVLLSEIVRVLS